MMIFLRVPSVPRNRHGFHAVTFHETPEISFKIVHVM